MESMNEIEKDIQDVILEDLINEYYKIKTEEKEYDNIIITTQLQFIEKGVVSKNRDLIKEGHEIVDHASDRLIEIVSIGKYLLSRIEEKINDTDKINKIIQKEIVLPTLNQEQKDKFNLMSKDIEKLKNEKENISSEMIKSLKNKNFKKFNELNTLLTKVLSKLQLSS